MREDGGAELGTYDLCNTMVAVEGFHKVKLDISLTPDGRRNGMMSLTLTAVSVGTVTDHKNRTVGGENQVWSVVYEGVPHDPQRFCSCIYRCLMQMDSLLSRERWAQMGLPL